MIKYYSSLHEDRLHVHGEKLLWLLRVYPGEKQDLLLVLVSLAKPSLHAHAN